MKRTFLLLLLFISPGLLAQEAEVDYLALASLLVKDGHYIRAQKTLEKINKPEEDKRAFYESLWGIIELQKKQYTKALNHFDLSQQLGIESSEEVSLYQAEAALGLENFQQSQNYLSSIKNKEFKKLPFYLISAEIAWKSGDKKKAWRVLGKALDRKFSKQVIQKKKFYFLLEEGLYQTASHVAQKMLSDKNSFNDVLAMASQLRQRGQFDLSLNLLQTLKVLRPKREMVALEMAQNYLAKKESFSAALILEESARLNPSLSYEAAELLRQLGKSYRAEFLNMSTSDPEKRLKQKLSLFLEDDDYHSLKFLIPELKKHDLLDDQDIRYAVAYSLFRTGDFSKSETLLNTIDKEGLFEKSIELKKEIGNCKESKWACRETI